MGKNETGLEIAVIGMSGRFPGAKNIAEFWENLKKGMELFYFLSEEELGQLGVDEQKWDNPNYVKCQCGEIDNKEYFDAAFFNYTPSEAEIMDPQIRFFHECAWEALEDAGYDPDNYQELIGVYAGASPSFFWESMAILSGKNQDLGAFHSGLFSNRDHLCARISYNLHLTGPACAIQTACSTSLVAVHLAAQGLLNGECDMALAGGVSISIFPSPGYIYQDEMISSPDGHCRAFDARAKGTVGGNGIGIVVLKRLTDALADRDHIYAIIKGSAINNDGNRKVGFTAPSVKAQADVILAAQQTAEVSAESISYIETHGTGTPLGDSVEIRALTKVFNTGKKGYCPIGSLKTNTGHLNCAAGVAGFIKAVLSLKNRQIPPSLHFEKSNPDIDFNDSPFYVNTKLLDWKNQNYPLRAGVSSFGIGGTNAHVIVEEAPSSVEASYRSETKDGRSQYPYQLILLSARTQSALDQMTDNFRAFIKNQGESKLVDMAFTLQVGRRGFQYRKMMVTTDLKEAFSLLSANDTTKIKSSQATGEKRYIIFMFPGLGAQYGNMGRELYQYEPLFRSEMDRCFKILNTLVNYNIKEILYPEESLECRGGSPCPPINQFEISQLAVFIIEYALAKLLIRWGIKPIAMMGYSFGEYAAACISGVLTLEQALKIIVLRGRLIEKLPQGGMLSVPLPMDAVEPLLNENLSIAIDNGQSCIVSGALAAIKNLEMQLKEMKIISMRLSTERALHSIMVEPILEEFKNEIRQLPMNKPQIPYISNVTGSWIPQDIVLTPDYWIRHMRERVSFSKGIEELLKKENAIFLEVGPGRDLSQLLMRFIEEGSNLKKNNEILKKKGGHRVIDLVKNEGSKASDIYYLLTKLGRLWLYGYSPDWAAFQKGGTAKRISMPTYPFESQYYWIKEDMIQPGMQQLSDTKIHRKPDLSDWFYIPQWKRASNIINPIGVEDNRSSPEIWLLFVNKCTFSRRLVEILREKKQSVITVMEGQSFHRINQWSYMINPQQLEHYHNLVNALKDMQTVPHRILYMWSILGRVAPTTQEKLGEQEIEPRERKSWNKKKNLERNSTDPVANNVEREVINKSTERGFYSLIFLANALGHGELGQEIQVGVMTDQLQEVTGEELLEPSQALILGAVKVIPQEYPFLICRTIDLLLTRLDLNEENRLANQVLNEMEAESSDTVVAYRHGYRWVQIFEPIHWPKIVPSKSKLREGGVYLITGGLGKIGLSLTKYLIENFRAKLVLIGRSPVPKKEEWDSWLESHEKNHPIAKKLVKMKEWEKAGGEILIYSADVSNQKQMELVISQAEKEFGRINGVIHAAGDINGKTICPIEYLDRHRCEKQFKAKINGLLVLRDLFIYKELDFCLLTSSLSPILGGLGFSVYAAANSFMDAFAYFQNKISPFRWMSVNWGDWYFSEENDSLPSAPTITLGASAAKLLMNPVEGIETFSRILNYCDSSQVAVSAGDLQIRIDDWIKLKSIRNHMKSSVESVASSAFENKPDLDNPYEAPQNQIEEILAQIWQEIFGYQQVGRLDDFFQLGGDSLKAITVISRIHKEINISIPLTEFFKRPTIQKLTIYINTSKRDQYASINPVEKRDYYELSSAQKRLFLIQQLEPDCIAYNEIQVMLMGENVQTDKFKEIFNQLALQHEILRTTFEIVEGRPVQRVKEVSNDWVCDFSFMQITAEKVDQVLQDWIKPFDLCQGSLIRSLLIQTSHKRHLLAVDMHHIITDGESQDILNRDFLALYQGKNLPVLKVQYKDYSCWQNLCKKGDHLKKQEEFWLKQFEGEIPVLNLSTDYTPLKNKSFIGTSFTLQTDKKMINTIRNFIKSEGVTLYIFLLAVYNILLAKQGGQEDIIVGSGTAGRNHPDLEGILGIFINTLALRNYPGEEQKFVDFLQAVKKNTLDAFENQDYPFEELVNKVSKKRSLKYYQLFDAVFGLQGVSHQNGKLNQNIQQQPRDGLFQFKRNTVKFDIYLNVVESDKTLTFTWEYCTDLFKENTIKRLANDYLKIISRVIENKNIKLMEIKTGTEKVKAQANILSGEDDDFNF